MIRLGLRNPRKKERKKGRMIKKERKIQLCILIPVGFEF